MTVELIKIGTLNKPHEVCEVGKPYAVTSGLRLRMY
jgi:hypothetical protein